MRAAGPPGWREQARKLLAGGELSHARIAAAVGVHITQLYRLIRDDRVKARMSADPDFRRRRLQQKSRSQKRYRIREHARAEAAEKGEPVEQVYERWGVA